jgi:hypothetical protein
LRQVPVDGFVILDDTDDMGNLFPHLVKVWHRDGLQKKDIDKALEVLERACREVK